MMDHVAGFRAATAAPDIAQFWKMESYVPKKAAAFQ
jgi:hypothetical protein